MLLDFQDETYCVLHCDYCFALLIAFYLSIRLLHILVTRLQFVTLVTNLFRRHLKVLITVWPGLQRRLTKTMLRWDFYVLFTKKLDHKFSFTFLNLALVWLMSLGSVKLFEFRTSSGLRCMQYNHFQDQVCTWFTTFRWFCKVCFDNNKYVALNNNL